MCCPASHKQPIVYDSSIHVGPPQMKELVGHTLKASEVRCLDMTSYMVVAIIGIAMMVFAAVVFATTFQKHGWALTAAPLYSVVGAVVFSGLAVTILASKWIVEACQKRSRFNAVANVETDQ